MGRDEMTTDKLKKSFILYCDQMQIFEALTDDQAGKLIKHIFLYSKKQAYKHDDPFINMAFLGIKASLDRDLEKYENICIRNKNNGEKGGRPPKPKKPSGLLGNPKKPKKADSDSDSDNDSDSDSGFLKAPNQVYSM